MELGKPTTTFVFGTDDKVAMSLDDLIKQQRKTAKKTAQKKKAPVTIKKSQAAGGVKNNAAKKTTLAAKSAGTSKANRQARLDQRRGLNPTGKASAQAVKTEVAKQAAKQKKQAMAVKGAKPKRPRKKAAGAGGPPKASLKVAFNTRGTSGDDRIVRQQVAAVMARQATSGRTARAPQQRSVLAKAARGRGGR